MKKSLNVVFALVAMASAGVVYSASSLPASGNGTSHQKASATWEQKLGWINKARSLRGLELYKSTDDMKKSWKNKEEKNKEWSKIAKGLPEAMFHRAFSNAFGGSFTREMNELKGIEGMDISPADQQKVEEYIETIDAEKNSRMCQDAVASLLQTFGNMKKNNPIIPVPRYMQDEFPFDVEKNKTWYRTSCYTEKETDKMLIIRDIVQMIATDVSYLKTNGAAKVFRDQGYLVLEVGKAVRFGCSLSDIQKQIKEKAVQIDRTVRYIDVADVPSVIVPPFLKAFIGTLSLESSTDAVVHKCDQFAKFLFRKAYQEERKKQLDPMNVAGKLIGDNELCRQANLSWVGSK